MGKVKKPKDLNQKKSNAIKTKQKVLKEKGKKTKNKSHILKLPKALPGIKKTISKKEKQKMKKISLEKRVELTKAAFKEDKDKKKRQKTAVVGDLKPLLDSLPSLDELLTLRDQSRKTGITSIDRCIPKKPPRTKQERREQMRHEKTEKMLDRFDHVQKIWRNPEFQRNPRKLIAEQIRKRREANAMMM